MRLIQRRSARLFCAVMASFATAGVAGCMSSAPSLSPLAGTCLTDSAAPFALAVGVRSNVPSTSFPAAVNSLLQTTAGNGRQITLIRIDGQPKDFAPAPFISSAHNPAARSQDITSYLRNNVNPVLQHQIHAQTPQADVLGALSLAAGATSPNGNIIVVDSGLQTVAPLNFQEPGLLTAQPSDVVSFLRKGGLLPDLKGRHVLLSGFGYAASPQPLLDEPQRNNVIALWEAIVRAGGGCVTVNPTPNTAQAIGGLPPVSVVSLPKPVSFSNCGTIVLSDAGTVGFVVGKSKFRNQAAAYTTLRQLADKLKQGSEHITLIGSTSSEGGDAVNNPLSQNRADAVKAVLVSMGIPPSRITAQGDGSHWPGRVNDIGPGGILLPAQAEQDREVIVQLPRCT